MALQYVIYHSTAKLYQISLMAEKCTLALYICDMNN